MNHALTLTALALCACAPAGERQASAVKTGEAAITLVETNAPAGAYRLDKHHASLVFRANHLGFSFYTAAFTAFDATLQFNPQAPQAMSVIADINVSSLQLPRPPAGFYTDLMGPDWFDADAHPQISYRSTGVTLTGPDSARVAGELALLGKTLPVAMDVTFNGGYPGYPPYDPQARIGFSAQGSLSRSAFGMAFGLPPEGSSMGVGDEITFRIDAEFSGPPAPAETPAP